MCLTRFSRRATVKEMSAELVAVSNCLSSSASRSRSAIRKKGIASSSIHSVKEVFSDRKVGSPYHFLISLFAFTRNSILTRSFPRSLRPLAHFWALFCHPRDLSLLICTCISLMSSTAASALLQVATMVYEGWKEERGRKEGRKTRLTGLQKSLAGVEVEAIYVIAEIPDAVLRWSASLVADRRT